MEEYTHFVWDFNGTVLDDVDACMRSADALLKKHGLPEIPSKEYYRSVFGFPIVDYYRRLGFDFDKTPYEELAPEWVEFYNRFSRESKVYPGVIETVRRARERGIAQVILSATQIDMLRGQLSSLGIAELFDEVRGLDDIHAYSKEALAKKWREEHPGARVLFFGDTDHDAMAARAMGADCILIAAGHQPKEALTRCGVLRVVGSQRELFDLPIFGGESF